MSYAELCRIQEYEEQYSERIKEEQIALGGIYTALVRFNEPSAADVAVRFPVRAQKLEPSDRGAIFGFVGLDRDFNEVNMHGITVMNDGLFRFGRHIRPSYTVRDSNTGYTDTVTGKEGYLSNYTDALDDEYLLLAATLDMASGRLESLSA